MKKHILKLSLIAVCLCLLTACEKIGDELVVDKPAVDKPIVDEPIENEIPCEFENPLTDLPWLKDMIAEFEQNGEYCWIYQVEYEGNIGFWVLQNPDVYWKQGKYRFINCEGETQYTWLDKLENIEAYYKFKADFSNTKLIWKPIPDPRITIEDLYAQPLSVIQEHIDGKWRLTIHRRGGDWMGYISYPTNTIVYFDTKNNRVVITEHENEPIKIMSGHLNSPFSISWEYKEVYPMFSGIYGYGTSFTTYVMQNNDQNVMPGWFFDRIQNDVLRIILDFAAEEPFAEYYSLIRENNNKKTR